MISTKFVTMSSDDFAEGEIVGFTDVDSLNQQGYILTHIFGHSGNLVTLAMERDEPDPESDRVRLTSKAIDHLSNSISDESPTLLNNPYNSDEDPHNPGVGYHQKLDSASDSYLEFDDGGYLPDDYNDGMGDQDIPF